MKSIYLIFIFFTADKLIGAVYHPSSAKVIAPFGLSSGQPPSVSTIQVVDFQIGFDTSQVCGYTDWSTVQVRLPKELLSKEYWHNIGGQIKQQARDVILQISGALPSMIACNISPQFCSVYNQAEALASFEASLTADSCKILDGISDMTSLHHEPMKKCVSEKMEGRNFNHAGQAIASCNSGGNKEEISRGERSKHISKAIEKNKTFTMRELIDRIFPDEVKTSSETKVLNSGGRIYSRYFKTKAFAKELFPGISVTGQGKVMHGGTFQDTPEARQRKEKEEIKKEVKKIIGVMAGYKEQGFSDQQILEKSQKLWDDRKVWKEKGEPSPIYRPSKDSEEPTFLIPPSQILMLLPLANREATESSVVTEEMDLLIEQLSSNASYIRQIDKLRDIYTEAEQKCMTDPELHSAVAQKNCDLLITRTKASIEMLMIKQESEERSFELHRKINDRVQARVIERASRYSSPPVGESRSGLYQDSGRGEIPVPGKS